MFITRPRPKKDALTAPPRKKRKAAFAIEEISFDDTARADYLTGFHKRKVQRQKQAQEIAQEKARQEKIAFRKELREQRQKDVEDHVKQVNEALRQARLASGEQVTDSGEDGGDGGEDDDGDDTEWGGIEDPIPEFVDHEEEYIDEDKYTTVTVEAVDVDREGMHALSGRRTSDSEGDDEDAGDADSGEKKNNTAGAAGGTARGKSSKDGEAGKKEWQKKKKKKFRYETKLERQITRMKQSRKR